MPLLSRSGRIILLLGLNIVMFLAEIIVGYKTSSLALIADAFHMLSDVLSQIIALYAIRLAAKTEWQPTLSYGWQRAELLGALYNGVFLLALCFSILLDAIERFFSPQDIENPKLVLIVGGIGLGCNLLGLALFHDHAGHGHSHGGGGHSHSHAGHVHDSPKQISGKSAKESSTTKQSSSMTTITSNSPRQEARPRLTSLRHTSSLERISPLKEVNLQNLQQAALEVQQQIENEERHEKEEEEAAELEQRRSRGENRPDATMVSMDSRNEHAHNPNHDHEHDHSHDHGDHGHEHGHDHDDKKGNNSKKPSGEDLNMRGIFLHVLGDALGSVGVIFTALFIWKTDLSWRVYMDPIVSILISAIIVHSALPLVRSASFILMQGVPVGVEIEEIRKEIKAIPDVLSIHDLHIWQLTNIKMVASLHVKVTNQETFERVSKAVKTIMHRAGVHSTTIQPEFPGMHPYFTSPISSNGLRMRRGLSDEDGKALLGSHPDLSSRGTSVGGAQSNEYLHEAAGGSTSFPQVVLVDSAAGNNAGGLIVTMDEEQAALDDANCAMLCLDGDQTCDVGSCCTTPVKR
ncbi:hypothetical protein BGZ83_007301 [Gryganskiella cystojenkinii]|nr:hypothetical protein BGZ83_007301 [Gryganskiella cystojenkinii]